MEINDLLKDEFENEWRKLTGRSFSEPLYLIKEEFNIQDVEERINESMRYLSYADKSARERYHNQNLKELTWVFARSLYNASNYGSNVNVRNIIDAKRNMKASGNWDIYPC